MVAGEAKARWGRGERQEPRKLQAQRCGAAVVVLGGGLVKLAFAPNEEFLLLFGVGERSLFTEGVGFVPSRRLRGWRAQCCLSALSPDPAQNLCGSSESS